MSYLVAKSDAIRIPLPDRSVDLVFGSPLYCDARTYGINAQRDCQQWVDWMLPVTTEALRVARNCVVWIAAGVTRDRNYWPACEGLMWEWWKRGGSAYRPCYWHRVGISGSGGDQWFASRIEYAMCFKHDGPLEWSDNTAMGKPPKFAPGGEMTYRTKNGKRIYERNWRHGQVNDPHQIYTQPDIANPENLISISEEAITRKQRGEARRQAVASGMGKKMSARDSSHWANTDDRKSWNYVPPDLANPGNLIDTGPAGGGRLGSDYAHENEAPFPEDLAEFFIRSLCKPGGTVLDPFSGSGTTIAVAERLGRYGLGFDLRESQARLAIQRIERPHKPVRKKDKPMPLFKGEDE